MDKQAQEEVLPAGQLVYMQDRSYRERNKFIDIWSSDVFQVVRPPEPGGAVYTVAPRGRLTEVRHVHRSLLKPVPVFGAPLVSVSSPSITTLRPDNREEHGFWVRVSPAAGQAAPSPAGTANVTAPSKVTAGTSSSPVSSLRVVRKST